MEPPRWRWDEDDAGSGQYVEAEVAAAFGPFVVLLGQEGTSLPVHSARSRRAAS